LREVPEEDGRRDQGGARPGDGCGLGAGRVRGGPGVRVAVVGGSGNVGTALMRALLVAPEVTSVLGISRRAPTGEPYASADWASFDIGQPADSDADEQRMVEELAQHLEGVDAVVHLAWLIQPNRDRDLLR